jgi:heptaprenyl diphosphate synthase
MENIRNSTKKLASAGILLGIIIALQIFESMLPPIPGLPLGVKLGLSNIGVMYALFYINKKTTLLLVVLKSLFVLLTRGATGGLISFSGGMMAVIVMIVLIFFFGNKISILALSIAGAIAHNIGQILLASILLESNLIFVYLPILILSGVIMGVVTGSLLRVILPLIKKNSN